MIFQGRPVTRLPGPALKGLGGSCQPDIQAWEISNARKCTGPPKPRPDLARALVKLSLQSPGWRVMSPGSMHRRVDEPGMVGGVPGSGCVGVG